MKVVAIRGAGGPEVLAIEEREPPELGLGEVRLEVAAAGLNRADVLQRKGFYPAPKGTVPDVPGLEYAGTIVEVSEGIDPLRVGERVMGIVAGGAMATELVVPIRETIPVPEDLSLVEAAAIPEVFITAWDAVRVQGELARGQTLLIHSVGSGIGTAAVQLARAWGVTSIGTSRTEEKLTRSVALGLDHGVLVPRGEPSFAARVGELTSGALAHVILDTVGGGYLAENVRALAPRGTLVVIGLLAGIEGTLPLGVLLAKSARIVGSVLRTRSADEKAQIAAGFTRDVLPLIARAEVGPIIDHVLPMADIKDAHAAMEADETFGKIVLVW
jgi:putative PIG3 family NAD(P)H quinone oxidoreductase